MWRSWGINPARSALGALGVVCVLGVFSLFASACGSAQSSRSMSFEDRLELLPASVADTSHGLTIAMADLDRAAELAGTTRPTSTKNTDAVLDYVKAVTGVRGPDAKGAAPAAALVPNAANIPYLRDVGSFAQEVGWSIVDVSWFVESQDPVHALMVAGGDFDEKRLTKAMGARRDGIWRVGAGDNKIDINAVSAARPIGQSLRLALSDGRLLEGRSSSLVKDAVDGDGRTLADDAVLRDLAKAMDDEDVYSALFAVGAHTADPARVVSDAAVLRDQVLPEAFGGVATGVTSKDGKPVVVLAYGHASEAAAKANATALRRILSKGHGIQSKEPWRTVFSIDDIRTDGTTLIARLRLAKRGSPQLAYRLLTNRESLVSHR